ncbi:hypothetical protein Fcan01_15345 [Folsomia candida]|uniref:Uncharacterized protein n=1 Tax=Folsomia candida TaxID=158441 RepID=A0A226DXH3_FOLCA|nr:hypothetical protein Fcan01_15345 [Folsomia candida]
MNQGFSFMTCYSRQELSFKIFLQPFKIEVWIALMLTMVSIGGFLVVSLTRKLQWGFLEAISLAQFAVISIALERPTYPGKKLMRMTVFKILLGVWLMLAPIMTYGYLEVKSEDKLISPDAVEVLKLIDLVDPWHMPYPYLENSTDTILISNQWDLEHAIVQCGRTVLVLEESELNKELRYFEKHYPWLKFLKSERSILKGESGWRDYPASGELAPYGDPGKNKYYDKDSLQQDPGQIAEGGFKNFMSDVISNFPEWIRENRLDPTPPITQVFSVDIDTGPISLRGSIYNVSVIGLSSIDNYTFEPYYTSYATLRIGMRVYLRHGGIQGGPPI